MPGRPPLPIGTHGKIRTRKGAEKQWRAMTLFRDHDGATRQVERSGTSQAKALRSLNEALRDRGMVTNDGVLTGRSRVEQAADLWLKKVAKNEATATTRDRYRSRLDNHVLPAIGQLLLRECSVARLDKFFDSLERNKLAPSTRRGIRTVVSGVLGVAVKHQVIDHNPVREVDPITGETPSPEAMTVEELSDFLDKLDADVGAVRADLPDYLRFLFGTGARFGEALGVRWRDVNLADEPITIDGQIIPPQTVWINGNVVNVKGVGLVRQDGKTPASNRIIGLPHYLYMLMLVRKPLDAHPEEPVFPSGVLGWRNPSNMQRSIRRMRGRIGYPKFTTHIGRKTVATMLDHAGHTPRQIADQMGHANPNMTLRAYMGRKHANPEAAGVINEAHQKRHA